MLNWKEKKIHKNWRLDFASSLMVGAGVIKFNNIQAQ